MSGTETKLLTAFWTIYFQLVENMQEAVTGHAETHRLAQLGDKINEFNEQMQQVSIYWIYISIGAFIFYAIINYLVS